MGIAGRYPDMVTGVISISGFCSREGGTVRLGLLQRIASLGSLGPWFFRMSLSLLAAYRSIYRLAAGLYAKDRKALYSYPDFEAIFDIIHTDAKKLQADYLFPFFKRLPDIDISEIIPLVSKPTLVVAGDCDPIVPPEQSRAIADKVLKAELHFFEGAGHLPMFERAEMYNAVIAKWVDGLSLG